MKKLLVTILAFAYLSASSGATINMHYCMGKLLNWDMAQKQVTKCGSCGMEKSEQKGCCKDEQKKLQIEKGQKAVESIYEFHKAGADAVTIVYQKLPVHCSSVTTGKPLAHAPPLIKAVPLFLLNCNFRI